MSPLLLLLLPLGGLPGGLAKAAECKASRPCLVQSQRKLPGGPEGVTQRLVQLRRGEGEPEYGQCIPEEWWLWRATKPPGARLVLSLCNDGYGSAGVGEDTITVKGGAVVHDQFGGDDFRWNVVRELQLSPPRVLSESHLRFHRATSQFSNEWKWSWPALSGERTRLMSTCGEDGQPDLREEAKAHAVRSALIPQVSLPEAFLDGGWKEMPLGSCAASARYLTSGASGAPDDTALRVVASAPEELWVELTDDLFVAAAGTAPGDSLELWLTDELRSTFEGCLGPAGKQATQWLIELPGGETRGGHLRPVGQPRVELVVAGKVARLHLRLPPGTWSGLALSYADTDDGRRVERTLSTSQLRFGQSATLGQLHPLTPEQARCEVQDGGLALVETWSPPATGPLFPASAGP